MNRFRSFSGLSAAAFFGAVAMAAQTLLLRRFLWRFESAETGVALFLSCWLFWSGAGSALACSPWGRRAAERLSRAVWPLAAACVPLYFVQYALIGNLRSWFGVPEYQAFPLQQLALGCFLANAPFGLVAGWVIPSVCRRIADVGGAIGRVFAWEALGAALGGLGVTLLLVRGIAPDPRDETEWFRYFPQAVERPGRFETGGGTFFYGAHGGTFYALSSSGVSEVVPEEDRATEIAALVLSQRPYAKDVLLLGRVPLAVGLALERLHPGVSVVWCPCDARYGEAWLKAVRAGGVDTGVRAAGQTPQRFLDGLTDKAFDAVLVAPPSAATLEGASWRQSAFARDVRRATRRTGVALFRLDCGGAALTPETAALLECYVGDVRLVWPESGVFAAGAEGWWIAAQVQRLAYDGDAAAARLAMPQNCRYPAEAVKLLYDADRAARFAEACPVLNPGVSVLVPESARVEDVFGFGLAEALRRENPELTPGAWLARLKAADGPRVLGLLLVVLWTLPVVLSGTRRAPRRLVAVWLAAGGALGLAVSLTVLYRLQMRFGSLYLLAGLGSCLYLSGLFCGNRLLAGLAETRRMRSRTLRGVLAASTLAQAALAYGVVWMSVRAPTAVCLVVLCFVAGLGAGAAVPAALAAVRARREGGTGALFASADAIGAAVGGLFFALLVPMAGFSATVSCFAMLLCGVGVCASLGGHAARLSAGLALTVALAVLGGRFRDAWSTAEPLDASEPGAAIVHSEKVSEPAPQPMATNMVGVPRKLDGEAVRKKMANGMLATNTAAFWQPK